VRRVGRLPMTSGLPTDILGVRLQNPVPGGKARRLAIVAGSAPGFDLHHGVAAPEPVHRAKLGDRGFAAKAIEHNADLLFRRMVPWIDLRPSLPSAN